MLNIQTILEYVLEFVVVIMARFKEQKINVCYAMLQLITALSVVPQQTVPFVNLLSSWTLQLNAPSATPPSTTALSVVPQQTVPFVNLLCISLHFQFAL